MHEYLVVQNVLITPTIRLLTLQLAEGATPVLYQPGQYAAIGMKDKLRPTVMRCFSITTSPTNQQYLQFSMRVGGKFTGALKRLKVGSRVAVRGPFGGFVFDQDKHLDVVLFAGGIGIAPFVSMARYATELGLENKIHLVYSCRDESELAFLSELKKLEEANKNLKVSFVVSGGPVEKLDPSKTLVGMVDKENLEKLKLNYRSQTFFICGPPAYMKAISSLLRAHKVPRRRILTEAFSQGSHKQTGKLRSWPFNMYALSGAALLISGFYIVATDLYKTIPALETKPTASGSTSTSTTTQGSINELRPTVSTNINQDPIVKNQTSTGSNSTTQSPTTTTTPSPTTTTPTAPPRTTVS